MRALPGKQIIMTNSWNNMRKNILALLIDADMLAKAAVEGRLATRADASKHQGDYRKIVQGVNDTLDAVIGPLNVAAKYVDDISKGAIPAKITDNYNGDFNVIKTNLNQCIDAVNNLVSDAGMLSKAAVEGKLSTRADASKHYGDYRKIVQGVNDTLDAVIGPLQVSAKYVDDISKGAIPAKITDTYNGDFNVIKNNLNQCIDAVNNMVADAGMLSKAAVEGKLSTRADASKHFGDYRKIVQGVNDTLDAVIGPLQVSAKYVDDISRGAIPAKITDNYNGDFNVIKTNLNQCIDAVNDLVADAAMLSKAAVEGKLSTRADASKHHGDYRKIVQGVNDTLDSVIGPINEAMRIADAYAGGDLTARVNIETQGDFSKFSASLDAIGESLTALLVEVNNSVGMVSSTSQELASSAEEMNASTEQVSSAIQQISKGAQSQAAQVDETAKAMKEISSSVQEAYTRSMAASEAAKKANDSANVGKGTVETHHQEDAGDPEGGGGERQGHRIPGQEVRRDRRDRRRHHQHIRPDQPAGAERRHRSRQGRGPGPRVRGGRGRGQEPGGGLSRGRRTHRQDDQGGPERDRQGGRGHAPGHEGDRRGNAVRRDDRQGVRGHPGNGCHHHRRRRRDIQPDELAEGRYPESGEVGRRDRQHRGGDRFG